MSVGLRTGEGTGQWVSGLEREQVSGCQDWRGNRSVDSGLEREQVSESQDWRGSRSVGLRTGEGTGQWDSGLVGGRTLGANTKCAL